MDDNLEAEHKTQIETLFMKCLNHILDVNAVLHHRTGQGQSICQGCGEVEEIVEHALLQCKKAQEICNISPIQ